jgi:putative ABC transport system permease protein
MGSRGLPGNLLAKKLRRDMLAIKGRVISLALIIASGVAILFAITSALTDLRSTQDVIMDRQHAADVEVQFEPADSRTVPDVSQVPGVAVAEQRLVLPGTIALKDGTTLGSQIVFQSAPQPAMNQLRILHGRTYVPGKGEVVIDKGLAEYHGYHVGQQITVGIGATSRALTIVGEALSPEYLVTAGNPDYVIAEPGSLGVLWADSGLAEQSLGAPLRNSIQLALAPGADEQRVGDAVASALGGLNVTKIVPRHESFSYKSVSMDVTAFAVYCPAIIVTLCLLSLAMGVITFRRFMIDKQQEFGVLAALGVRRRRVRMELLRIGFAVGVLGTVVGLVLGYGVGWGFSTVYAQGMHMPEVVHRVRPSLLGLATAVGIVTGIAMMLVAGAPMFRKSPRQLLTPPGTSNGSARVPKLGFLPVAARYGVRGLLRERSLTLSAVVAMGAAVAVAISYGMAMTSTFDTVKQSFDQEAWAYAVDFQRVQPEEQAQGVLRRAGAGRAEPYLRALGSVQGPGGTGVGTLVGVATPASMHLVHPYRGRAAAAPGEAVVSKDLMEEAGAKLGERVRVGGRDGAREVTVVGVTNDMYLRTVNVDLATVQGVGGAGDVVSGAFFDGAPQAAAALSANSRDVARVTDKRHLVDYFHSYMNDLLGIVYITIAFAVGVSVIFVTTLVYLSIAERRGEFAVLRSMGFGGRRVRGVILTNVAVQVVGALVLSVPFSLLIVQFLNQRMGAAWFAVDLFAKWSDFAVPMAAAFVVAPVVGLLGARSVLRLDIPRFLRGRSI